MACKAPVAGNGCMQVDKSDTEGSFNSWSSLKPVKLFADKNEAEDEADSLQVGSCVNFEEDGSKINLKALHRVRAYE